MNRRRFLKQSTLSIASLALMQQFLLACKPDTLHQGRTYSGKVIVVGAGAAGLYAAYLLHLQGVDVQLLEASSSIGGRVKSLSNFADFTVELGAEEVLGERSIWYDMVRASGAKFIDTNLTNHYYFNGSLKSETQAVENTFFNNMIELISSIKDYTGNDITALAWGNNSGLSTNVIHLFEALIGNKNGTSNARLGMFGLREVEEKWTAGNENISLKDKSFIEIFEERFTTVLGKVVLNTPINAIDYSGAKIILYDEAGNIYEADKVIVTLPISILKNQSVLFTPALDANRLNAFQKIGMDRGLKVILKFDERFWPENTGSIYGNGLIPEFWATAAGGRGTDNVLTAFVHGENAELLAALGTNMISTILSEIDNILGKGSDHYVDHFIQDWGDEQYIQGAFSYSKPGTENAREIIAENINNRIYFAGEATHTGGHAATVHGAMETGLRAVNEILNAI